MTDDTWIETVRLARDLGDISSVFPPGINRLWDLPFTLFNAIGFALNVLSWRENCLPEEMPPKHLWLNAERMEAWWREVKENRRQKMKGGGDYQAMPQNALLKTIFGRDHG